MNESGEWWDTLSISEQESVSASVELLMGLGPALPFPQSSGIVSSRHGNMRKLRVQSGGKPLRVFYACDPRHTAILLIGGDKTGDDRFCDEFVPHADRLYGEHLKKIEDMERPDGWTSSLFQIEGSTASRESGTDRSSEGRTSRRNVAS